MNMYKCYFSNRSLILERTFLIENHGAYSTKRRH
jgi:hypothetical protein